MGDANLARELYRWIVTKFHKRKVVIRHIDEIWATDTMHMLKFSKENCEIERRGRPRKGLKKKKSPINYTEFKYILVVIDCFSKFLWLIPMNDKSGIETSRALEKIIKTSKRTPVFLWTYKGGEFRNKDTRSVLQKI